MVWVPVDRLELKRAGSTDLASVNPAANKMVVAVVTRQLQLQDHGVPFVFNARNHTDFTAGRAKKDCVFLDTNDFLAAAGAVVGANKDQAQAQIRKAQDLEYSLPHNIYVTVDHGGDGKMQYFRPTPPVVFLLDMETGLMHTSGGTAAEKNAVDECSFSVCQYAVEHSADKANRAVFAYRCDGKAHEYGARETPTKWTFYPHAIATAISTILDEGPPGDIDQRDTWQVDHIRPEETFGNILETMRRGPVHVTLCQSANAMAAYSRRDKKKGRLDGWRGRLENLFEPIILGNAIQLEPGQKEAFVLSHVAPEQWPWRCSDHDEEDHGGERPNKKSKGSKQQSASTAPTTALTNGRR